MNLGMTMEQALDEAARIAGVDGSKILGRISAFGDWQTSGLKDAITCAISVFNENNTLVHHGGGNTWTETLANLKESLSR